MARRRVATSLEGHLPSQQHDSDLLAFAVSGLSHVVLILLAFAIIRNGSREPDETQRAVRQPLDTTIVFLPPPPPAPPAPQAQPVPITPVQPVPRTREQKKEEDPNAASDVAPQQGVQEASAAPQSPEPSGDPDGATTAKPPVEEPIALAASMESEAQRLFGRRRGPPSSETGPVAVRPFENAMPADESCPKIPRDSTTGEMPEGVVQGRVIDYETGRALGGAHLQMVGQPYNTFADDGGNFVLRFDLRLMENCRVQVVRISAVGHRDQTLPIVLGGGVSTVPLKRR